MTPSEHLSQMLPVVPEHVSHLPLPALAVVPKFEQRRHCELEFRRKPLVGDDMLSYREQAVQVVVAAAQVPQPQLAEPSGPDTVPHATQAPAAPANPKPALHFVQTVLDVHSAQFAPHGAHTPLGFKKYPDTHLLHVLPGHVAQFASLQATHAILLLT